MQKMHSIMDLLDYENADLWRTFDDVVASELFEFNNLGWIVEIAKLGYEMQLPYKAFWGALVNVALLKHQEFHLFGQEEAGKEALIDLVFFIVKALRQASASLKDHSLATLISLDKDSLPANLRQNSKLFRKAQLSLLLSHMRS